MLGSVCDPPAGILIEDILPLVAPFPLNATVTIAGSATTAKVSVLEYAPEVIVVSTFAPKDSV